MVCSARRATSLLCVITISVTPRSRRSESNRSRISLPDCESRLPVGSSAKSNDGSLASAAQSPYVALANRHLARQMVSAMREAYGRQQFFALRILSADERFGPSNIGIWTFSSAVSTGNS